MKLFQAAVSIMPHPEILDPKGKATENGLHQLGFQTVENVRIGKQIAFRIQAATADEARKLADEACQKLLVNRIMEGYTVEISAVE